MAWDEKLIKALIRSICLFVGEVASLVLVGLFWFNLGGVEWDEGYKPIYFSCRSDGGWESYVPIRFVDKRWLGMTNAYHDKLIEALYAMTNRFNL